MMNRSPLVKKLSFQWGLLLCVAAVLWAVVSPRFPVGHFEDDARDILAAQSLLQGRYANLQNPAQPLLNFPLPGFPLFLSPFVFLVQGRWEWLKILPGALSLLMLVMMYRLARSVLTPEQAMLATGLMAINPLTVYLASCVIVYSLFGVVLFASFLRLQHYLRSPTQKAQWLLGFWLAIACLIRPEGKILGLAIGVAVARERPKKELWRILTPAMVILLGWGARNYFLTQEISGYSAYWIENAHTLIRDPFFMVLNLGREAHTFMMETFCALLPSSRLEKMVGWILALSALGFVMKGIREYLPGWKKGLPLAVLIFCGVFYGMHGVWLALSPHYFYWLLPWLYLALVKGMDPRYTSLKARWYGRGVIVFLLMIYGIQYGRAIQQTYGTPHRTWLTDAFQTTLRKERTVGSVYVLAPSAANLTLQTGMPSLSRIPARDVDFFRYRLHREGITHVMIAPAEYMYLRSRRGDDPEVLWSQIAAWIQELPSDFIPIYADPNAPVKLYRVRVPPVFVRAYETYEKALEAPQLETVLDGLEAALAIDDQFPEALNAYGATCYLLNRKNAQAEARLREAVRLRPGYRLAWLNLSRILERKGDKQGASHARAQALSNPK